MERTFKIDLTLYSTGFMIAEWEIVSFMIQLWHAGIRRVEEPPAACNDPEHLDAIEIEQMVCSYHELKKLFEEIDWSTHVRLEEGVARCEETRTLVAP